MPLIARRPINRCSPVVPTDGSAPDGARGDRAGFDASELREPPNMRPSLEDLRPLVEADGPFLTLLLPAPSHHADAAERFSIRCENALKAVSSEWPADDLASLEADLMELPHDAGASVIVIRSAVGAAHTEFIDDPVDAAVFHGTFPRLAPLIESRQRTVAHLVIEADKAGAGLVAFDGGRGAGERDRGR